MSAASALGGSSTDSLDQLVHPAVTLRGHHHRVRDVCVTATTNRLKIESLQTDTSAAVTVTGRLSAIASAVEEQTVTTNDIGRNLSEAATATTETTDDIIAIKQAAGRTRDPIAVTERATPELKTAAPALSKLITPQNAHA